jgi:hypothetical protein
MRRLLLAVLGLALSAGCNGQMTEGPQPLPEDEARKHEAPRMDGSCAAQRAKSVSWSVPLEARDLALHTDLRIVEDPCGNVVVTWGQIREADSVDPFVAYGVVVRLFRDGLADWGLGVLGGRSHLRPFANPSLVSDQFGNILLLAEHWLQVFTAAGGIHPTMPLGGIGPGGTGIVELSSGWLIQSTVLRLLSLPSGRILLERPETNHTSPQRHSFLHVGSDRVLWNQVVNGMDQHDGIFHGTNFYVFERGPEGTTSLFSKALYEPTLYAEAALLASDGNHVFMGSTYYKANSITLERIECSESVLIDIRDEAWKPDPLGFCGAIEAMALVDGSLFSLWSVPVEPLDPEYHPFEAVPFLMRHDLDGRETGRFDLESIIGRTHQDGTGALDMAITGDGKAAIVGILNGGPWNGRFYLYPSTATVARVPLE